MNTGALVWKYLSSHAGCVHGLSSLISLYEIRSIFSSNVITGSNVLSTPATIWVFLDGDLPGFSVNSRTLHVYAFTPFGSVPTFSFLLSSSNLS
jgi:hypothetical protein